MRQLRPAARHGPHRRDRGLSAGRSGVPRVSRHDAAQPLAVPRCGPCLCVSVLRHLLYAQRVERETPARARAFCCARWSRCPGSSACDARARACASRISRAARAVWRRLSASICRHDGIDLFRRGELWIGSDGTEVGADRRERAHRPHQGRRRPAALFRRRQSALERTRQSQCRDPLAQALEGAIRVVLDGALATELERRGADLRDPLWSAKCLLEQPEIIRSGASRLLPGRRRSRDHRDLSSDASRVLAARGIDARGRRTADARGGRARRVSARAEFWAEASLGPRAAAADRSLRRTLRRDAGRRLGIPRTLRASAIGELAEFHRPRLEVLAHSGADLIAFETLPCLREALVLARLLEEYPGMSAWMSFSCRDGAHNCEGEDIAACAAALRDCSQIAAVGVNCTAPRARCRASRAHARAHRQAAPRLPEFRAALRRRDEALVGARPATSRRCRPGDWYAAGARLVGGCCRTHPRGHSRAAQPRMSAQRSEKCGSRFSKNARTPSTQSCVSSVISCALRSARSCSCSELSKVEACSERI